MTSDSEGQIDYRITLVLDAESLPVSYVSSTLRVIQAALRDFARSVEGGEALFGGQPQPVLLLDATTSGESDLVFELYFADPDDEAPMSKLSAQAFEAFIVSFGKMLKRMPQRDLWGVMSSGSGAPRFDNETDRRLNELRTELRHFGRAVLRHGTRSITFDGDQLEIE